jgi:hypothetical protein
VVQPWIDELTKQKIQILGDKSQYLKAMEQEGITLDQLPEYMGGSCKGRSLYSYLLEAVDEKQQAANIAAGQHRASVSGVII